MLWGHWLYDLHESWGQGWQVFERVLLRVWLFIYDIEVYFAVSSSSATGTGPLVAHKMPLWQIRKRHPLYTPDMRKETYFWVKQETLPSPPWVGSNCPQCKVGKWNTGWIAALTCPSTGCSSAEQSAQASGEALCREIYILTVAEGMAECLSSLDKTRASLSCSAISSCLLPTLFLYFFFFSLSAKVDGMAPFWAWRCYFRITCWDSYTCT